MGVYTIGKSQDVQLKDFAPDLPHDTPGILLDAQGAIPTVKGYQALNLPLPHVYGALPETPIGSTVGLYSSGGPQHWAGGANHLYRMQGTMDDPASTWVVADSLGPNTFNATTWRFAQFNDDLIAVGGAGVPPQVATGQGGTFAVLGGNPPNGATLVLAVNSQVMMFVGNTWYVSAIGSDNSWAPATQTQAGFAPITDFPGDIIAAQPLYRQVIAFKQQGIWLGTYVGQDSIWAFQPISNVNGTWSQEATMAIPEGVAFLGLDDFYICTGYTPERIPNNVKEWFFDTVDPALLPSVTCRYDPYHAIGYWHFVSKNPPFTGVPDRFVAFNFRAQRWVSGYLSTPCVPVPNFHFGDPTDISGFYFDTQNILQTFRGPAGSMRLLTGYMGMSGQYSQLMRVRPKYDIFPAFQNLQPFHVAFIGEIDREGPTGVVGPTGWFYTRQYARYHRVQLDVAGCMQQPQAVDNLQQGAEVTGLSFEFRGGGTR